MQEINFYHALQKPGRYAINAKRARTLLSLWVVCLLVIFVLQISTAGLRRAHLAFAQYQEKNLTQQIESLIRNSDSVKQVHELGGVMNAYSDTIAQRSLFSREIDQYHSQNHQFTPSAYFKQLSNATTENVWLTKISFTDNGNNIRFTGLTYSPPLLMQFINTLQKQILFQNKPFKTVSIDKTGNPTEIPFTISTAQNEKKS